MLTMTLIILALVFCNFFFLAEAPAPAVRCHLPPLGILPQVQCRAPDFKGIAVVDSQIREIQLSDYEGKFLLLFFYPQALWVKLASQTHIVQKFQSPLACSHTWHQISMRCFIQVKPHWSCCAPATLYSFSYQNCNADESTQGVWS